ncbi:uncharacterized protein EV422DRAFT_608104 [Fimicolochytrium jonesii]|uniref:uncharacterized protein n=1 Tax=Fimicolochytrium jonesii TaxID=1396493 RepID=UPI0022FE9413|nr:uncharacterized protein EV422DRAFT_608104 [Fimicolochytrium jonesii]KAI8816367.1 hypothetical protein EV422DRAFT_608104 [Fimicolochytrium jonesii]
MPRTEHETAMITSADTQNTDLANSNDNAISAGGVKKRKRSISDTETDHDDETAPPKAKRLKPTELLPAEIWLEIFLIGGVLPSTIGALSTYHRRLMRIPGAKSRLERNILRAYYPPGDAELLPRLRVISDWHRQHFLHSRLRNAVHNFHIDKHVLLRLIVEEQFPVSQVFETLEQVYRRSWYDLWPGKLLPEQDLARARQNLCRTAMAYICRDLADRDSTLLKDWMLTPFSPVHEERLFSLHRSRANRLTRAAQRVQEASYLNKYAKKLGDVAGSAGDLALFAIKLGLGNVLGNVYEQDILADPSLFNTLLLTIGAEVSFAALMVAVQLAHPFAVNFLHRRYESEKAQMLRHLGEEAMRPGKAPVAELFRKYNPDEPSP